MNDKQVYKIIHPFPILKQHINAFEIKLIRDLGKNEYSAIFISVIEALINNNHLKKIEPFYQKSLTTVSSRISQAPTYQSQLKNYFTTTKNIQFLHFLEKQKTIDPNNQISGEFLRSYYLEKQSKAITVPSIIDYFQKYFDLQVLSISQRELSYFRSKYTSKSIIIYQEQQRFYSLIASAKEEELSLSTKQITLKKQCAQCNKPVDQYFEDHKQHAHCIQCLYNKFFEDKLFHIFCPIAQCSISKQEFEHFIKKNDIDTSVYRKTQQKICSYCKENSTENDFFINTCKHVYCRKCYNRLDSFGLCMVSNCTQMIDRYSLKKMLASGNDLLSSSQRMVQEVKKPIEYSTNLQIGKSLIDKHKDSGSQQQLDLQKCEGCFKYYKIDFLFTNFCGHQYCQICTNKYVERNVSELKCYGFSCFQKINVQELQIFFQELLEQQYKEKQLTCSICKAKYESQKELYKVPKCLHLVCFTCINKQYMLTKQSWLAYGRCPEITCKSSINIDDVDEYFTTRQQEKLMEIDSQSQQENSTQETLASQKLEQQEVQNEDINKIAQVEDKQTEEKTEDKMGPSIIKQEKKKINLKNNRINSLKNKNGDEQSKVEESKDLESVEDNQQSQKQVEITGNCSMCGEDYSQCNIQIKMDCIQDHLIGICCFLSKYKKCMVCEKDTPYDSNRFEIFSSKLSGMYQQKLSSYGSSSNYYGSLGNNLASSNYRVKDDYRPPSNSSAFRNSSQMPVRRY